MIAVEADKPSAVGTLAPLVLVIGPLLASGVQCPWTEVYVSVDTAGSKMGLVVPGVIPK